MPGALVIRCQACQDTTWITSADGARRCSCWLESRQTYADGTPLEFRSATAENYRSLDGNEKATKAAAGFATSGRDLYLSGPVGCIAGETVIGSPDGDQTVAQMAVRGQRVRVWSLSERGPVSVEIDPPFVKGFDLLYRVTLQSGRSVLATRRHVFLTDAGWLSLAGLRRYSRLGYSPSLQASTPAHGPSESPVDVRRCFGRGVDCSGHCSTYCRRCDQQPQSATEAGRGHVPSPAGALGRSLQSWRADDRQTSRGHIRPCQPSVLLAKTDSAPSAVRLLERAECRVASWHSEPPFETRQGFAPRPQLTDARSVVGATRALEGPSALEACEELYFDAIRDIQPERADFYFDLHVPGTANYLANGIWHHNSGKTRLACSVLNDQHKAGVRGFFARVPMLLLKLQPQAGDEAQSESAHLLRRLLTVPVLVLDDIGAERDSASDFTRRTLLTVYEERGDQGLRTIWTSNLRLEPDAKQASNPHRLPTLGEFMGDDRLASRIAGRAQIVHLTTFDQRIRRTRGEQ